MKKEHQKCKICNEYVVSPANLDVHLSCQMAEIWDNKVKFDLNDVTLTK